MESNAHGTYFQEGDRVRVKQTGEQGRINAADGGVVYVIMDGTRESRLFSARLDEDAYIEFIEIEGEESLPPGSGTGEIERSPTTTM